MWDVFNNSSEAMINFIVTDEDDIVISDFRNFPNPFTTNTDIYFEHNKVNQELNYVLEIYSITGVLVKRIDKKLFSADGYRIGPISWDGKNNYGVKMNAGIYIANLRFYLANGNSSSKSIRIILLPDL